MKHQALFSLKDKGKEIKLSSAATFLGASRVNADSFCFKVMLVSLV